MRLIVLLLLLANVALFYYWQVYRPPVADFSAEVAVALPAGAVALQRLDENAQTVAQAEPPSALSPEPAAAVTETETPPVAVALPPPTPEPPGFLVRTAQLPVQLRYALRRMQHATLQSVTRTELPPLALSHETPAPSPVIVPASLPEPEPATVAVVTPTPPEPAVLSALSVPNAPTVPPTPVETAQPSPARCFLSSSYSDEATAQAGQTWLQTQLPSVRTVLKNQQSQERASTWIYLPPFKTAEAAQQAQQQLAVRGVRDYTLVNNGNLSHAISLGVYHQDEGVQRRLAELRAKGYHNVRLQERYQETRLYWLEIRLAAGEEGVLEAFAQQFSVPVPHSVTCE